VHQGRRGPCLAHPPTSEVGKGSNPNESTTAQGGRNHNNNNNNKADGNS
jgi:hypothetical protein